MTRALYDCPAIPLTPAGPQVRLVVAAHDATSSSPTVGVERDGTVYELFVSMLPSPAFTASDVLDLYLHRGSFETVLAALAIVALAPCARSVKKAAPRSNHE